MLFELRRVGPDLLDGELVRQLLHHSFFFVQTEVGHGLPPSYQILAISAGIVPRVFF